MEISQEIIEELDRLFQNNHQFSQSADFKSTFDLISYKSEILEPRAKALLLKATDSNGVYFNYPALLEVCGADSLKENKVSTDQILEIHPAKVIFLDTTTDLKGSMNRLSNALDKNPILKETLKNSMRILSIGTSKEPVKGGCNLLESLAEIIYPHEFDFGHEGHSWIQ